MRRIAATVFLLLWTALALLAAYAMGSWLWRAARMHGWAALDCTIEASAVERHPEAVNAGREFRFVVSYRYAYQGRDYAGDRFAVDYSGAADAAETHRLSARFPPGAHVLCRVDPGRPSQAVLSLPSLWSAFGLAIPLLFIAVGVGGLYLLWRPRRAGEDKTARRVGSATAGALLGIGRARAWLAAALACVALAGAVTFCVTFLRPLSRLLAARSWPASRCLVEANQIRARVAQTPNRRSITAVADILYTYRVGDRRYESNRYDFLDSSAGGPSVQHALAERYPEGSTVVCWVNPDDPTEAVLSRELRPAYLVGLLPLAMFLLGAAALAHVLRGPAASDAQERGGGNPQ
jgi:hypothetical protein